MIASLFSAGTSSPTRANPAAARLSTRSKGDLISASRKLYAGVVTR
jgi:hypothetical protein